MKMIQQNSSSALLMITLRKIDATCPYLLGLNLIYRHHIPDALQAIYSLRVSFSNIFVLTT